MDLSVDINNFFDRLSIYEDVHNAGTHGESLRDSIVSFITKQDFEAAKLVYITFFKAYWIGTQESNNPFIEIVESVKDFESTLGAKFSNQRDHYIHSANVFILGISIYELSDNAKDIFLDFVKGTGYKDYYQDISEEFLYRWGVASLFHDVAYPVQLLFSSLNSYLSRLFRYPCENGDAGYVLAMSMPSLLQMNEIDALVPDAKFADEFYLKYPSLRSPKIIFSELISEYISKRLPVSYEDTLENVLSYEKNCTLNGMYDHAYYGAMVSLKWYHSLINSTKWNPSYFYYSVVDSSCAIFLHNAYKHMMMKFMRAPKLKFAEMPISYLLILCDELQEWSRPAYGEGQRIAPISCSMNKLGGVTHVNYHFEKMSESEDKFARSKYLAVCEILDISSLFQELKIVPSGGCNE